MPLEPLRAEEREDQVDGEEEGDDGAEGVIDRHGWLLQAIAGQDVGPGEREEGDDHEEEAEVAVHGELPSAGLRSRSTSSWAVHIQLFPPGCLSGSKKKTGPVRSEIAGVK
jgi:hypothetical protein